MDPIATLNSVFGIELIASELLSFLGPRELSRFSASNRSIHNEVRKNFVSLCQQHLSIQCGHDSGSSWALSLCHGCSFPTKEGIFLFLYNKMKRWGYCNGNPRDLIDGDFLKDRASWSSWCRGPFGAESASFSYVEKAANTPAVMRFKMNAGLTRYFKDVKGEDVRRMDLIRDWVQYISSQAQEDAVTGIWSWECTNNYPPRGEGTMGKGIMITLPDAGLKIELKFTAFDSLGGH